MLLSARSGCSAGSPLGIAGSGPGGLLCPRHTLQERPRCSEKKKKEKLHFFKPPLRFPAPGASPLRKIKQPGVCFISPPAAHRPRGRSGRGLSRTRQLRALLPVPKMGGTPHGEGTGPRGPALAPQPAAATQSSRRQRRALRSEGLFCLFVFKYLCFNTIIFFSLPPQGDRLLSQARSWWVPSQPGLCGQDLAPAAGAGAPAL